METKKIIKRKVVCVYGKFDEDSDFVIEPACGDNACEECDKESFWIQKVEENG